MKKKITMVELARLAEVDISTVSRALADSPLVKKETRDRIQRIAFDVGYAVNASASSLRRQTSGALGMVIPLAPDTGQTMSDPFYLEMVGAVSQAASERDYDLIVSVPRDARQVAERRLLQTGRADGLIVIGQAAREDRLHDLGATQPRVVVWGGRFQGETYTTIGSDNVLGGRLAAQHLLDLGCRRVLFLGDTVLPEVKLRFEGLLAAHAMSGVSWQDELMLPMNFGGSTTYEQVLGFARAGHRFDAIFAASDLLAISAMHACAAAGLSVPGDVKVVGYDNIGLAAMATPPLTTVSQNIADGGGLLVELLLKKINGEAAPSQFTRTELIVRKSSALV